MDHFHSLLSNFWKLKNRFLNEKSSTCVHVYVLCEPNNNYVYPVVLQNGTKSHLPQRCQETGA